jgi:hypothetical protein
MTGDVENLILERLRRFDGRLGHPERGVAELSLPYATLSTRVDRIDLRLQRIERRPHLADA